MAEVTVAYVRCYYCDQRINLFHMKDFESYSYVEVTAHYQARHPELFDYGLPYTDVKFEIVEVLR